MTTNMPKSDVWELIDKDSTSQNHGKKFKFDFSYIESENIKNVVKTFTWRNYREGNKSTNSLHYYIYLFKQFNEFSLRRNILEFKKITNSDIEIYVSFLRMSLTSKGKPYAIKTQKGCLDVLKTIIRWGQLFMPNEVPITEIFTGNEYIGINRKLRIDFIPDEVLNRINNALKNEENPYVKYGIIILQSTGMRIGDMLKLTTDCIKPHLISGYTLTWYDHKNKKERNPMPIINECAIAIEKLIEHTKNFREQADNNIKDYLFIYQFNIGNSKVKKGKIINTPHGRMQKWFKDFIEKNNIRDTNEELYNLTAHQFRRTLATDMLSKGTNINVIANILGNHVSTTKRFYSDIKDNERIKVFEKIGIIGNINKVDETLISDEDDLLWFKDNKNKGARMEDGYCTKPCTDGKICERLLKRQKCYTCSRYITTPEYLQAHKDHLEELERQLEANLYGKHYAEHFLPTIEVLKEIIRRLEGSIVHYEVAATSDN